MTRRLIGFCLSAVLSSCCILACTNGSVSSPAIDVTMPEQVSESALSDLVSELELIALSPDALLGEALDMEILKNSYIIADRFNVAVWQFAEDGSLICPVGHKGNGPAEYASVNNIQVLGDKVLVYSQGGKVLEYDLDGKLISTTEIQGLGPQSYKIGEDFLTYKGYLRSGDSRLQLVGESSVKEDYLVTDNAVLSLSKVSPVFEEIKSGVAVLDTWNPVVYQYHNGELKEYLRFNFGKYAISDDFFNSPDPMAGAMTLMKGSYAVISKYFESDKAKLVEIDVIKSQKVSKRYAFTKGGDWHWFSLGGPEDSPMAGGMVGIDQDYLYILLNPIALEGLDDSLKNKISNPEVLETIEEDGNYVLAKLRYVI